MRPAHVVAVLAAAGGVAALPSVAAAQSDWPPADKQAYVDSGRYLADVQAAAAPAKAWLIARTDQIAADRAACTAAGLRFPAPVAPAAAAATRAAAPTGGADPRAAGQGAVASPPVAGSRADVRPLAAGPHAAAGRRAAGSRATAGPPEPRSRAAAGPPAAGPRAAATWDGATTLMPNRRAAAVRRLRRAGVRLQGTATGTASWDRVLLRTSAVTFAGGTATVRHAGTLRLRAHGRSVTLGDVRLSATPAGRVRVTVRIGRSRTTLLTGTAPKAGRTVDPAATTLGVPTTRLRLTSAAAKRLRMALRVASLGAGPFATVSVRATRGAGAGPGAPGPTTPAPDGSSPAVTATPPTASSCAAIPARPAIVLDIDETALSNYLGTFGDPDGGSAGYAAVSVFGAGTALQPVFDLYGEARRRGVAVFFITARPGIIEASTVSNLRRVGYTAWDGLTFKNDLASDKDVHKTAERRKVEDAGYRIVLNVGDQQTDIDGGYAERAFKLPNPFY